MLKIRKAITDDGSLPIARDILPLIGTIDIGDLTCRIRIMRIRRYCIIPIRGFMDSTRRTTDITEATIRIMDIIEVIIRTQMSIGVIAVETTIPRSHGVPTIEGVGVVKVDVHGAHAV